MLMTPGPSAMVTPAWMGGPGAYPTAEPATSVPAVEAPAAFLEPLAAAPPRAPAPWNRPMEPAAPPKRARMSVEAEENAVAAAAEAAENAKWAALFVEDVVYEMVHSTQGLNEQARRLLLEVPSFRAVECGGLVILNSQVHPQLLHPNILNRLT